MKSDKPYRLTKKKNRVIDYPAYRDQIITSWESRERSGVIDAILRELHKGAELEDYTGVIVFMRKVRSRMRLKHIIAIYDDAIRDVERLQKTLEEWRENVPKSSEVAVLD